MKNILFCLCSFLLCVSPLFAETLEVRLGKDYSFMEKESYPIIRTIQKDDKANQFQKALGVDGYHYIGHIVPNRTDSPYKRNGRLVLPGGHCSASLLDEDPWYGVTACHCVEPLTSVDSAIFEAADGTRYPVVQVFYTQTCASSVNNIPTEEDGAIFHIMPSSSIAPTNSPIIPSPPTNPPRPTPPCFRCKNAVQKAFVDFSSFFLDRPLVDEIISVVGYPVLTFPQEYQIFSTAVGMYGDFTVAFGGNMNGGASGAAVWCNWGNPIDQQMELNNRLCGILTVNETDGSGETIRNGAAILGPWFAQLLADAIGTE